MAISGGAILFDAGAARHFQGLMVRTAPALSSAARVRGVRATTAELANIRDVGNCNGMGEYEYEIYSSETLTLTKFTSRVVGSSY